MAATLSKPVHLAYRILTDLPPVYWQDAVRHMKRPYLNYWLSDAVYAQIINSDPDTCEFEMRYFSPHIKKGNRSSEVSLQGIITYDSDSYGGYVELKSELKAASLLFSSLLLLLFIPFSGFIAAVIFNVAFRMAPEGWMFILSYLVIISGIWGFYWRKPRILIQIAKNELDTEAFFMANPDLRKKK